LDLFNICPQVFLLIVALSKYEKKHPDLQK